jgi:hypothetical protein
MRTKLFFALLSGILVFATSQAFPNQGQSKGESHGAQDKDQITPEEISEAQEMADRFIRRFRETRDLTPIVNEMFTSHFKKMVAEDISWSGIVGQGRSLPGQLKGEQRLRCFIVSFNLSYMIRLYIASKVQLETESLSQAEDIFPSKVSQFFKDNAPDEAEIKTTEQALKVMSFLEQAVILMQEEVRKNPPEETEQFKKNLVAFKAHLDKHEEEKPSVRVYNEARHGLPAGARLIRMVIPFHVGLGMVKEGRELKIDLALTHLPPD